MRITSLEIFRIMVPFKRKYIHTEAHRKESENIVVRIQSDDAICGIGETIPREYLTAETPTSIVASLTGT
jgi:L-alanine-DL-glutamate epimerase-like enolase superfamily enzyme